MHYCTFKDSKPRLYYFVFEKNWSKIVVKSPTSFYRPAPAVADGIHEARLGVEKGSSMPPKEEAKLRRPSSARSLAAGGAGGIPARGLLLENREGPCSDSDRSVP